MRPNWSFSVRLDEILYFVTWPLVYLLSFTRITPNQVGLISFLSGIGFIVGMAMGFLSSHPLELSLLLFLRICLDCADGQLARYTNQTSNLGKLYDLVSDFIFALLLFIVLARVFIQFENTDASLSISISAIAAFCFFVSSTVFSYIAYLNDHSDIYPSEAKQRFISSLENDSPDNRFYALKLSVLNWIFRHSWRFVAYIAFLIVMSPEKSDSHPSALRLLSPLEYDVQLMVLSIIIFFQFNLAYFLVFEIVAFCALFLLLLYHYKE